MVYYSKEEREEIREMYIRNGHVIFTSQEGIMDSFFETETVRVFHCPIEEVPLYISSHPLMAGWRLKHGK